ncbi:bifunctional aspartate kinase/homoserine dehydrogenase I [Buchnera aphidicola str. APS (Acyrthosiphon pisum)]|uniref:Bifunctional aspartokinase/homoserine dehydrogenase n=1 Tax=Buchnera aphidicola subsp. Acyrthosiphon pisum (strain APS) TaxID=107806 RepID=AKH_BUCAI|nr:bifunctional aspartate kinase/homoserine dehydrogenase I [Buchnera aphidicola]P57290.1 RecName: Full=Bifunctional aspartokinase/homoserine dehydrogenase; Short=AK-HD; Includes: RecName: Full=Aspartokinase; Includes: RecName: Full=Homoserine dehydrogenase [Buchnera aphidicola str. APS (Acyrthosiphon pisum)]pir/G84952/ aspartate kinase (EC 2.7.2.4) / homoserine dehydrogenase (EC 1.1.1.3) [imported] - Buchnera sp. (strain APS) [Buchnera sp. (in: enterobacteria)]BAB12911.1 aspartokinase I / homos
MKLLKFGGTSLANAEKFLSVSSIIEENTQTDQIAVVLSAPAKITNYLVKIIENTIKNNQILETVHLAENIFMQLINNFLNIQSNFPHKEIEKIIKKEFNELKNIIQGILLLKQCPDNIRAIIISRGEILSVFIMKSILQSKNYNVTIINPVKNLVAIGDNYLDSTVDISESKKNIQNMNINQSNIILMAGFIAGNKDKKLVVLGRNGSDYSAAVLAACLDANCCEIWTDVDGVFTSDPRKVPNARLLKSISYQEAMELSYFGAKVLHPRTIEPIAQFKIPCLIKNTNNVKSIGTLICEQNCSEKDFLKGVTHLDEIAMFNISGPHIKDVGSVISRIFTMMSRGNIKILLITQSSSENKINFCVYEHDIYKILYLFNKEFQLELKDGLLNPFKIKKNLSILSIVGSNIYKKHNIASKIFSVLGALKINVIAISQGSSKHSISLVIKKENILKAVQHVHNTLFFNKKTIHMFLIGIGGIGSTLLNQILKQKQFLDKKNIEIKICAIANSKKILLLDNTNDLSNWKNDFKKSTQKFNLELLNNLIKNNHFSNSVIVDCTSSQLLSEQYVNFIDNNFHVVTSNKKANTSEWNYYKKIRKSVAQTGKKFLYETNVGAGLPVIETLQNLFKSGDNLICFKGILSGSLSFIFGRLEEGILLSQATREAKELGFTEPNPCDDLSGIDVARKLLILARESGYNIELKDIKIEPLLPNNFKIYEDTDKFLLKLKELDVYFSNKIKQALNVGNVLRFVATIEQKRQFFIKLEEVNINNPLYKVKNGENALAFYTNYYQPIPLVLRGYGAGNNVTASGVFSDLLRTLS